MIFPPATSRTLLLPSSTIGRSPLVSSAISTERRSSAEVASPPSPLNPRLPVPASVEMIPVAPDALLKIFDAASEMYGSRLYLWQTIHVL